MSNHLAFANVTAALVDLLTPAVSNTAPGASVTAERPDTLKDESPRVNVFLYQVTPNAAWRNADLPTRRPDGTAGQRPQAAFDLHYVLSFYGDDKKYEPQRLLGRVESLLHAQPVLSPGILRGAAKPPLDLSNLAEQGEAVRLVPTGFNLEELSKLWSVFFQVPYRLSVAFQASVVLIEPEMGVQPALPVRARNLVVAPFRQPALDEIVAAAGPGLPIFPGDTIVLRGRNLSNPSGSAVQVRIGGAEVAPAPADVAEGEIRLLLAAPPFPPGTLRAGVVGAQVVQPRLLGTPPLPHAGTESNAVPFVLRPRIRMVGPTPDVSVAAAVDGVRAVTVGIEPAVGAGQRAVLLLNEPVAAAPRAFSAVAGRRANDADPVVFQVAGLAAGTYLVRVQVDGAESPLSVAADGSYDGPEVTVP